MRVVFVTALASALVLAQATPAVPPPASETSPAAAPAAKAATAKPEEDPIICREQTPLGTRFPQRVCERKSVMERAQRESRRLTEDAQTRSRGPFVSPR